MGPAFPVCIVFGHEVDGIRPEVAARCDMHIRIPMLGSKHSLNVATAGGVVLFELLRKYQGAGETGGSVGQWIATRKARWSRRIRA